MQPSVCKHLPGPVLLWKKNVCNLCYVHILYQIPSTPDNNGIKCAYLYTPPCTITGLITTRTAGLLTYRRPSVHVWAALTPSPCRRTVPWPACSSTPRFLCGGCSVPARRRRSACRVSAPWWRASPWAARASQGDHQTRPKSFRTLALFTCFYY